jgi:small subunit ribosomal protein S21
MKRELRAHEHYEKPCEARRRKELSRQKAIRKAAATKAAR